MWLLASHDAVEHARDVAPVLPALAAHEAVLFKFEPVRGARWFIPLAHTTSE